MHAVIKIISFLIFGIAVSTGGHEILLAGVLLIMPLYFFERGVHLKNAFMMLRRLKWLFLSILIVYLFFTPGRLLIIDLYWGPTVEGLIQGLSRIFVLLLLVAAVNLLISSTQQDDLLSAILWCLRPLAIFGIPHERLAVRISLTLEAVSQVREDFRHQPREGKVSEKQPVLSAISATAHRLFLSAIQMAESTGTREVVLPEETSPPLSQWLIPIILAVLFAVIHSLSLNNAL
jgi:hypothetical protein